MAITITNSALSPRLINGTWLGSGNSMSIDVITPDVASLISSGDIDIGSDPIYENLRPIASFPVTDRSGAVKKAITGHGAITAGADGTDGTFALAFTGGTGTAATGTFTVESGALTAITITSGGVYSVVPTAFDFSASEGLTGADASVTSATVAVNFAAANSARNGWTFKNTSDITLYVDDTGTAASSTSPTSKAVVAGAIVSSIQGFSSKTALSVYGATLGKTYAASEW